MFDKELESRARRLADEGYAEGHVDRLYMGLRFKAGSNKGFREIGDFIAHKDKKNQGEAVKFAQGFFRAVGVFMRAKAGIIGGLEEIREAARSNIEQASDEFIRTRLNTSRSKAKSNMEAAFKKAISQDASTNLTPDEYNAIISLGGGINWTPYFTSKKIIEDFKDVLIRNEVSDGVFMEKQAFKKAISMHAVAALNGAKIVIDDQNEIDLKAGVSHDTGTIVVRAELPIHGMPIPTSCMYPVIYTPYKPHDVCMPNMHGKKEWGSLSVNQDGCLYMI